MTVTEYRHDDVDAPELTGEPGSLLTVLDACLVNGYGNKPASGWTKPLSDTNRAAYQNSEADGGTGCYVRVDDADGQFAGLETFADMSDIDTGVYGTWSDGSQSWLHKSQTADGTPRPWMLWADGLTWWLYVLDNGWVESYRRNHSFCGAGDYACFDPTNAFRYFALGQTGPDTLGGKRQHWCSALSLSDTPNSGGLTLARLDGMSGGVEGRTQHRNAASGSSTGNCGQAQPGVGAAGDYLFFDVLIGPQGAGESAYGIMRGVRWPIHRLTNSHVGGDAIGNLVFTPVNSSTSLGGSSNEGIAVGALLVDREGPW